MIKQNFLCIFVKILLMKRFYYGVLLCLPFYFFVASKKKVERVDSIDTLYQNPVHTPGDGIADFLPFELKEEYLILISVSEKDRDEDINNRIKELESIIKENMENLGYEESTNEQMKELEIQNDNTINNKRKEKSELSPLNVEFTKNIGREVEAFSKDELLYLMETKGFKRLDNYSTGMLRRIWLAYNYDQFFWDVHYKTNFPISIIYAYFIMEATLEGVESDLMATYMNPGGIKYRGFGKKTKAFDDCYDRKGRKIKCDFAVFDNYDEMVNGWASVFNQERYADCIKYNNAADICKCLYKSGYHTANNWKKRANLSREYWKLRTSFP